MHVLYRKLNFRNIRLDQTTIGEPIGVYLKNDTKKEVPWLGFVSLDAAKLLEDAVPVRLDVTRVDGVDLDEGCFVQGALVGQGVFAVVTTDVRIVRVGA